MEIKHMVDKLLVGGLIAAVSVPLIAQTTAPAAPAPVIRVAPVTPPAPMAMPTMTRADVTARVAEHFARLDANKDGALTLDEARPGRGDRMKRVEMRKERISDPNAAFDRLDTDRNGAISRDEFAKGREMRVEKRIEMKGARADMHRMHMRHHGAGMGMMRGPMMLKMADANKDGRITLQEATSATLQHFDMADANRDGRLTPEEMRAAHQKMHDMRMPKAS
jgi:Ca2+-binding EF-hand superfamily protein